MNFKLLVFILILGSPKVFGLSSTFSPGAISSALAGSGHSSVDVGESYILNPGTIAHLRGAAITMGNSSYQDASQKNEKVQNSGWHLSLNEYGADSIFATSIYLSKSGSYDTSAPFSQLNYNDAWFTLGNYIAPNLSAGLSYHLHETEVPENKYQEHALGLGFLWNPNDYFGLGFSIQNISTSRGSKIPDELKLGTNAGIGLLFIYNQYLQLRLDYSKKNHRLESQSSSEWSFGLENSINPWILTRIGISQSVTEALEKTRKWTFGMGFAGPRFGIHYAYQQHQQSQKGQEHSVDLVIPF